MRQGSAVLWPREHGTYGELLFPLATALLLGRPGVTAWALCAVALGGFLAHEGFVVLAGRRGERAKREDRPRATTSLMYFGVVAVVGGAATLPGIDARTAIGVGIAIVLACLAMLVAWFGAERSLSGELIAALALSAWCVPVSLAGGLPTNTSVGLWSIWFIVFALGTTAVESVMARSARRSPRRAHALSAVLAIVGLGGVLAATHTGRLPPAAAWTLLPTGLLLLGLMALPIHARHVRSIGWSIVAMSVVTLALMVGTFAGAP